MSPDDEIVGGGPQAHTSVTDAPLEAIGYQQITTLSAPAKALTIPTGAIVAVLQAEAQNIRFRDDGPDPTAAIGQLLFASQSIVYTGELSVLKFIEATPGAILNVLYYKY